MLRIRGAGVGAWVGEMERMGGRGVCGRQCYCYIVDCCHQWDRKGGKVLSWTAVLRTEVDDGQQQQARQQVWSCIPKCVSVKLKDGIASSASECPCWVREDQCELC